MLITNNWFFESFFESIIVLENVIYWFTIITLYYELIPEIFLTTKRLHTKV